MLSCLPLAKANVPVVTADEATEGLAAPVRLSKSRSNGKNSAEAVRGNGKRESGHKSCVDPKVSSRRGGAGRREDSSELGVYTRAV